MDVSPVGGRQAALREVYTRTGEPGIRNV